MIEMFVSLHSFCGSLILYYAHCVTEIRHVVVESLLPFLNGLFVSRKKKRVNGGKDPEQLLRLSSSTLKTHAGLCLCVLIGLYRQPALLKLQIH